MGVEVSERDVPLEQRLRQKRSGFATQSGEAAASASGSGSGLGPRERRQALKPEERARANKNRPLELTSKRAVGRHRQVVEVRRGRSVDPRFEAVSGRLNDALFARAYAFVDDYKVSFRRNTREGEEAHSDPCAANGARGAQEAAQGRQEPDAQGGAQGAIRMGGGRDFRANNAAVAQHEINLRAQELAEKKKSDKIKSAITKRKREEREAVASGKNPFYLKVWLGFLRAGLCGGSPF